jgi:hypothetical protein
MSQQSRTMLVSEATYTSNYRVSIRPLECGYQPVLEREIIGNDGAYWSLQRLLGRLRKRKSRAIRYCRAYAAEQGFPLLAR